MTQGDMVLKSKVGDAAQDVVLNRVVPRRHPGRWLAIIIIVIIAIQALHGVAVNANFHWGTYAQYLVAPNVLRGVWGHRCYP